MLRNGQKAQCVASRVSIPVFGLPPQFRHNFIFVLRDQSLDCEFPFDEIITTYKNGKVSIAGEHKHDIVAAAKSGRIRPVLPKK